MNDQAMKKTGVGTVVVSDSLMVNGWRCGGAACPGARTPTRTTA